MTRSITAAAQSAIAASRVRTAHIFRATFTNSATGQDEVFFLTDNYTNILWKGDVYTALGYFLGFEGVSESTDLQISTVKVTLSGVDQSLVSAVLQYQYMDRSLEIWRVLFGNAVDPTPPEEVWDDSAVVVDAEPWVDFGTAGTPDPVEVLSEILVDDPIKIFDGTMDAPLIAEDPSGGNLTVQLSASSHFADFGRRPGRHTNHQEQQAHFPGDRFFEWVGKLDKDVVWGRTG